tara:strand:+ start:2463 stop:2738 length:276 start_codon:yes stop_codon:yes gene_type:complete
MYDLQVLRKAYTGKRDRLDNSFAESVAHGKRTQHFQPKSRPGGKLSPLERLPSELIEEIIDALLDDMEDYTLSMLAVGISSHVLYPVSYHV